ncbi:DUF4810 domain-containing protein [Pseudomonas sp. F1_0610]
MLLTACGTPRPNLYQWEGYQVQVYERFTNKSSPEAQIEQLEKGLNIANSKNAQVPPGYHAHLGMLYAEIGKMDQMVQQFKTEKTLYPESAQYMDFLLRNVK